MLNAVWDSPFTTIALCLLVWNALVFLRFGWDKSAAIKGQWRVSEAELLLISLLLGSPGAKLAQAVYRHKTTKQPFAFALNMIVALHILLLMGFGAAMVFPEQRQAVVDFVADWALPTSKTDQPQRVRINRGL